MAIITKKKSLTLLIGIAMGVIYCIYSPKQGIGCDNVLRISLYKEPSCLDPRKCAYSCEYSLSGALFEGLMRLNSNNDLEFAQAESVDISPDGKTYIFTLEECCWSNGEKVTAHDFAKTWIDILNPLIPSPHAYLLDPVKNAIKAKRGEISADEIGIKAINDSTLKIELEKPFPPFLRTLATIFLAPIHHKNAVEHPDWAEGNHFIGNGPFTLAFWKKGESLTLVSNKYYKEKKKDIEAVRIVFIEQPKTLLNLFSEKYLDFLSSCFSPVPSGYLDTLKEQNILQAYDIPSLAYISFNNQQAPFNNKNIRKAFALAMNRKDLVENFLYLDEKPAYELVPPCLKNHKSYRLFGDSNPLLAQRYLESGLKELGMEKNDLNNLVFSYSTAKDVYKNIALYLQQYWFDTFGINIQLKEKDLKYFFEDVKAKNYDMGLLSFTAEYADPLAILQAFTTPKEIFNTPGWFNPKYNKILDNSSYEKDEAKREKILLQAEALFLEEMPIAPIYHCKGYFIKSNKLKNVDKNSMGIFYFNQFKLAENP